MVTTRRLVVKILDAVTPSRGIGVKYIYSACVVVSTPDIRMLHDPWFTDGIYDGSWFQYPKVASPLELIGDVDSIYVSHLHPDHYDRAFLKAYFSLYGEKEVLIADHKPNHLLSKMRADQFTPTVLAEPRRIGGTEISILPHRSGSVADIDSAIVIRYFESDRVHCVVNANDVIFDDVMIERLKTHAGRPDILLCGYTGAGPYPQTYFDGDDPHLPVEAERKKQAFFKRYLRVTEAFGAEVNIPFAGQYVLGGKLAGLNEHRGVADATEMLSLDPKAVVLADHGGAIHTGSLIPTATRTERYPAVEMRSRIADLSTREMDYERLIRLEEISQLPIRRLLVMAATKAASMSECDFDYYFVFSLPDGQCAIVNANRAAQTVIRFVDRGAPLPTPRSEILIDPRYLFGLLTNVYHWNNAEVGSQFNTRRFPNEFNRRAQSFLNFLRL